MATPIIVRETEDGLFVGLLPTRRGYNDPNYCEVINAQGEPSMLARTYESFMATTYEITERQKARFVNMANARVPGGGDFVSVDNAVDEPVQIDFSAITHIWRNPVHKSFTTWRNGVRVGYSHPDDADYPQYVAEFESGRWEPTGSTDKAKGVAYRFVISTDMAD